MILSSPFVLRVFFRDFSVTDMLVHQLPLKTLVCIVIMYISLQLTNVINIIIIIDLEIIKRVLFWLEISVPFLIQCKFYNYHYFIY